MNFVSQCIHVCLWYHPVDHINDALVHVQDYIQTIGIAAPEDKALILQIRLQWQVLPDAL